MKMTCTERRVLNVLKCVIFRKSRVQIQSKTKNSPLCVANRQWSKRQESSVQGCIMIPKQYTTRRL